MICRSAFAASDPTPPRPVVQRARSEGVEPRSLPRGGRRRRGEVPPQRLSIGSGRLDATASRAQGGSVRIGTGVDEVLNDRPLTCRVPVRCAGFTDDGCVQGFSASAVAGADAGASRHEMSGRLTVVSERRGVQRGGAFVDLGVTVSDKELVAAREARCRQRRCSFERCPNERAIARRDRHQQPREILGGSHRARYLAGGPKTAATPLVVVGRPCPQMPGCAPRQAISVAAHLPVRSGGLAPGWREPID
jgi:hypothetical protein